jgi:hypothetical protein
MPRALLVDVDDDDLWSGSGDERFLIAGRSALARVDVWWKTNTSALRSENSGQVQVSSGAAVGQELGSLA